MTRNEEIDLEIRQQAIRLYLKCTALFELPRMVYTQIMLDNTTRRRRQREANQGHHRHHAGISVRRNRS